MENSGIYLGTTIDNSWWRRYREDGFFSRGNGRYEIDDRAVYFYKYPFEKPIVIPFDQIVDLKIGRWHAGKWGGGLPILKVVWKRDNILLNSGFILSRSIDDTVKIIDKINKVRFDG